MSQYMPVEEFNLRDYARVLFRHKLIILTSVVAVMVIVFIGLSSGTPMYETRVKMLISGEKQVNAPYYRELLDEHNTRESVTQSEIVISDPVLQRVVESLQLYNRPWDYEYKFASVIKKPWIKTMSTVQTEKVQQLSAAQRDAIKFRKAIDDLRANIKVEPIKDTKIFVISVKDFDPLAAALAANVVSRSYIIFDLEQQMAELQLKYGPKHPVLIQIQDNIKYMEQSLGGQPLSNADAFGPASVKIIEQARIPLNPTSSRKMIVLIASFLASLCLGIALAFIFEYMDQTIKSVRDVENIDGVAFLGSVPKYEFPDRVHGMKVLTDQFRLWMDKRPFKTVYIAASDTHDNPVQTAVVLCESLAEYQDKRILIIDADLRHPSMHKIFNIAAESGLSDVLRGKAGPVEGLLKEINPNLSVLVAGQTPSNPVILLNSVQMRSTIEKLKDRFDLIFICGPDLSAYPDGYILASLAQETILVVSENQTRRQIARGILETFKGRNVHVLGVVLSDRTYPVPKFIYEHI